MTRASRLNKLEQRAAKLKPPGRIIVVDHDGDKWISEGVTYTTAEWEAMRAAREAEGEDDTVFIIEYDGRSPEEIRRQREHPQETRTTIQYPNGNRQTVGIDIDKL